MERQHSMPSVTLTNLLIGSPPVTSPLMASASQTHGGTAFNEELDEDDIYRGPDPRTPMAPTVPFPSVSFTQGAPSKAGSHSSSSSSSSSSTSSSSSSSSGGIGFNIIPSVIEHAIARWARGRGLRRRNSASSSGSSTSYSSSTSSDSSVKTNQRRRRKRSPSLLSHTTSLTTRRQARAASRTAPREFILFLPPQLNLPAVAVPDRGTPKLNLDASANADMEANICENEESIKYQHQGRELRTSSLKLMGAQLSLAMKRNAKTQRPPRPGQQPVKGTNSPYGAETLQGMTPQATKVGQTTQNERGRKRKSNEPHVLFDLPPSELDYPHKDSAKTGPSAMNIAGLKKGKGRAREVPRQFFLKEAPDTSIVPELGQTQQPAWWLDVASPTWDDMRALGKLLQLHPLTLEDILQKESREKFELFPRLGYYFVVFRAIDTKRPELPVDDDASYSSKSELESSDVIDITNVYLVVFKEGICTFHFEDISPHLDTVRRRVLQLEETLPMTSDWIAHGLMDSIVDAFFPVLTNIQKEVSMVEDFVAGLDEWKDEEELSLDTPPSSTTATLISTASLTKHDGFIEKVDEKKGAKQPHMEPVKSIHTGRGLSGPLWARKWWYLLNEYRAKRRKSKGSSMLSKNLVFLRRMTTTRRLVTTLTRLLSSKSEVVAQIRKRLTGNGEVAIYLGDVQDHIITLHQALADHERMLSQSHPAYLSHLKLSLSEAKDGLDEALLLLSLVSLLILCTQSITSSGGMNVNVPRSDRSLTWFWVFLAVASALGAASLGVARYLYIRAHGGRPKIEQL